MKIQTVQFIVKHSQVGCTENFETKGEEGTGFYSSVNFKNYLYNHKWYDSSGLITEQNLLSVFKQLYFASFLEKEVSARLVCNQITAEKKVTQFLLSKESDSKKSEDRGNTFWASIQSLNPVNPHL